MLSLIVPMLNAAPDLPSCLAALTDADEIIVVDGGSTDDGAGIARRAGARLIVAPKGRGAQLHAGADAAAGDWLLFVHADTRLEPGWRAAVDRHIAARPSAAGYFTFRLDDPAWQARAIERLVALRARWLKLPYGDQGLLISRAHYDRLGGFAALPLMEDVDLVRRIGWRHLHRLDGAALTSAERWRRDGWWRRSARNLLCLTLYRLGMPAERIARLYA